MKPETKQIFTFVILAYLFTWVMFGIQIIRSEYDYFTGILSILGPAIAALVISHKTVGIKKFLKDCFIFEQRFIYYGIFLIYAVWRFFLCMYVGERVEGSTLLLPILLIPICILQGGNEEFGWRGYLQPQLEKKMHSVLATFIITIIWTCWHIPLWFIPGNPGKDSLIGFFIFLGFSFTNSFSLAVIYKLTGSVLLCVIFHAWSNAITNTFMPTGDLKTIAGFALEGVISMIILILCANGTIKNSSRPSV